MDGTKTGSVQETFVGEGITPEEVSFQSAAMEVGKPGLPRYFSWRGRRFTVRDVLREWKEAGDCRHGSGERYVRKHWFHIRTDEGLEMKLYFERQRRSSGDSRWRLFSTRDAAGGSASIKECPDEAPGSSATSPRERDRVE